MARVGASITLGDNSEAELEALLASGEDSSTYGGLSPGTAVPSDTLEMPPLEFVISNDLAETIATPATDPRDLASLPPLRIEVSEEAGIKPQRNVSPREPAKRRRPTNDWFSNTLPPQVIVENESRLSPEDRDFIDDVKAELRGATTETSKTCISGLSQK